MNKIEQLRLFKEEILVIALERWLINNNIDKTLLESYFLSLKKVITSLTKNWATDFIIFNLAYYKQPSKDDYKTFKRVLNTLKNKNEYRNMNTMSNNLKETNKDYIELLYEFLEYVKSSYNGENEFTYDTLLCELADNNFDGLFYNTTLYQDWEKLNNTYETFEDYLGAKGYIYEHLYRSETGGMSRGEYCQGVFSLNGIAYSVEWAYYSFSGYNYEDASETLRVVKPIQKTITIYE